MLLLLVIFVWYHAVRVLLLSRDEVAQPQSADVSFLIYKAIYDYFLVYYVTERHVCLPSPLILVHYMLSSYYIVSFACLHGFFT